MNGAAVLRDRLLAAGVTLALDAAHNLEWQAETDPPPALLAEARRLKPELLALLRTEAANDAGAALLPLAAIIRLVQAIAAAKPSEAPEKLRAAIVAMLAAGHGAAETRETLLPALPLGTDRNAVRCAVWDAETPPWPAEDQP